MEAESEAGRNGATGKLTAYSTRWQVSNFDNELSKTAVKLDLYFKEGLFYEKIREKVPRERRTGSRGYSARS